MGCAHWSSSGAAHQAWRSVLVVAPDPPGGGTIQSAVTGGRRDPGSGEERWLAGLAGLMYYKRKAGVRSGTAGGRATHALEELLLYTVCSAMHPFRASGGLLFRQRWLYLKGFELL